MQASMQQELRHVAKRVIPAHSLTLAPSKIGGMVRASVSSMSVAMERARVVTGMDSLAPNPAPRSSKGVKPASTSSCGVGVGSQLGNTNASAQTCLCTTGCIFVTIVCAQMVPICWERGQRHAKEHGFVLEKNRGIFL